MTALANAQAQFLRDGYAQLPVFAPEVVTAAQQDITDHLDRMAEALHLPFAASHPDAPLADRLNCLYAEERSYAALLRQAICTDAHRGPRLQALANDPALLAAAETVSGEKLSGAVVRLRASIACFPEHHHPWHSDVARDDGTRCGSVRVTAWIPLSAASAEDGGLEIATGRQPTPLAQQLGDGGFHIPDDAIAPLPRVAPDCATGDVIFLDRFTPHRTMAAKTSRFALVVWMLGS